MHANLMTEAPQAYDWPQSDEDGLLGISTALLLGNGNMEPLGETFTALLADLFLDSYEHENPMMQKIHTFLPRSIRTVGEAAQYYADTIGYELVTGYPQTKKSDQIANYPIKSRHRKDSIKTVEDAITALLDPRYGLAVDHEYRIFAFEIAYAH